MRLGRGIGVGGGGGILIFYIFFSVLEFLVVSIVKVGVLIFNASGLAIQSLLNKRMLQQQHQDDLASARQIEANRRSDFAKVHEKDVALAHRITAQLVHQVEYHGASRTSPPALWGVYLVEPSCGRSYANCGPHPKTLKKIWLENRHGTVHELLILRDKPMAVAAVDLLMRGVFKVKPDAESIVSDFAANGMPILRCVQPNADQAMHLPVGSLP